MGRVFAFRRFFAGQTPRPVTDQRQADETHVLAGRVGVSAGVRVFVGQAAEVQVVHVRAEVDCRSCRVEDLAPGGVHLGRRPDADVGAAAGVVRAAPHPGEQLVDGDPRPIHVGQAGRGLVVGVRREDLGEGLHDFLRGCRRFLLDLGLT